MSKLFLFFCFIALAVGVMTQNVVYAFATLIGGIVLKIIINFATK